MPTSAAIRIDRPVAGDLLVIDTTTHVAGIVTGTPESDLDSVTIQFANQTAVTAIFAPVVTHPPQKLPTWTFQADVPVPGPAGPTTATVSARFDSSQTITASQPVTTRVATSSPALQKVFITFNTHSDNKNANTLLHVFVKNRSSSTATPERASEYVANLLEFKRHEKLGDSERNPYLAFGQALGLGVTFEANSTHQFDIPLRTTPIPIHEVVLPVVNVHILPDGSDRWIFDYTVTFQFDDGRSFSASSVRDGITGIVLDQDNRNHSGLCTENPFNPVAPPPRPVTDAVLTQVTLAFHTHNDNKNNDTQLNVHIVNRLSASSYQDIAIGLDLLSGQDFPDPSTKTVVFSASALPLASNAIRLQDMVLPLVFVNVVPTGSDRWIFDYKVTFTFSDGSTSYTFSSRTDGVILDAENHKHVGVYEGDPFPTLPPPRSPGLNFSDQRLKTRTISLAYLETRLGEFINLRTDPPIRQVRLDNTGIFGSLQPESYFDLQSIEADPPAPGPLPPTFVEGVRFTSSPRSLDRLDHGVYFDSLEMLSVSAHVDLGLATPLIVEVTFKCSDEQPTDFHGSVGTVTHFSVRFGLTFGLDESRGLVDLMSWVSDIQGLTITSEAGNLYHVSGHFLGQPVSADIPSPATYVSGLIDKVINVKVTTPSSTQPGGIVQEIARQKIYDMLTAPDPFDGTTARDRLNETVTGWLVGGSVDGESGCAIESVAIQGGTLQISYRGPRDTFVPSVPAGWPSGTDFSPGNLANIDHIVVLTMENRSFDSMLGYLSLTTDKGGMGRNDVDGLKGGEFNLLDGQICPSVPFVARDTIFAPDPPHDYELVQRAIDGGKMDGFAQSFAVEHGPALAARIMGYHPAENVPVFDALARDFAIGHRWFASHPGPTFCNRFHELTGRLNLDVHGRWEYDNSSPMRAVFTPTIFDYLTAQNVTWKYFEHHYCFLRFFQNGTFDPTNIVAFEDPGLGFAAVARAGALPSVTFIDPHYIELPPGSNCDGPPADVAPGQDLVQRVVEALASSPTWAKTLLIITYDEHGGFYDHVPPPPAVKVTPESIDTYGVRVPTFVVSPWVTAGSVFGHDAVGASPSLHFDHTSILKTIARRFLHQNPPFMGARYAAANDLSSVLNSTPRVEQFRPFIPYNFVSVAAQLRLDVQTAGTTPGTVLQHFTPNTSNAQQFAFEDAGQGFVYIRTRTGNLYLTADPNLSVRQDVKYPKGAGAPPPNDPQTQRWRLTSVGTNAQDRDMYVISNAAFAGRVLQQASPTTSSGTPVVLTAPIGGGNPSANAWRVTSG
ncbi:MAG: RICIN domain-containing protein [Chloroflexi bacterium]|nr:RICIN domain-containing protein [Chloroflexota bacterium]